MKTHHAEPILPCGRLVAKVEPFEMAFLTEMERRFRDGECPNGYLLINRQTDHEVLLFYNRALHSAVRLEDNGARSLPLVDFFTQFHSTPTHSARLCATSAAQVLLMAVVFQNKPILRATFEVANLDRLLDDLESRKQTAGMLVARGGAYNLAFWRNGIPLAVFFADVDDRPADLSIRDQLLAYGYTDPTNTLVEVFTELHSQRADHFDRPVADLLAGRVGPPPFMLTVTHGSKRVQRRLIVTGRVLVGRDPACDIVLDHLSVSREHCVFAWRENGYIVQDCGSANGTRMAGVSIDTAPISSGDVVTIGEFAVTFGKDDNLQTRDDLDTLFYDPAVPLSAVSTVMYQGEAHPMHGAVFTMGKGRNVDLRLGGLRMQRIQATIVREGRGAHRLLPVKGGHRVIVDGKEIGPSGVLLYSGNEIVIGRHTLVFVLADGEAHAKAP